LLHANTTDMLSPEATVVYGLPTGTILLVLWWLRHMHRFVQLVHFLLCVQLLLLNGSHGCETSTCGSRDGAMRASDVVAALMSLMPRTLQHCKTLEPYHEVAVRPQQHHLP
jgi:hypothetical protein